MSIWKTNVGSVLRMPKITLKWPLRLASKLDTSAFRPDQRCFSSKDWSMISRVNLSSSLESSIGETASNCSSKVPKRTASPEPRCESGVAPPPYESYLSLPLCCLWYSVVITTERLQSLQTPGVTSRLYDVAISLIDCSGEKGKGGSQCPPE